jgi:hypothetical protein
VFPSGRGTPREFEPGSGFSSREQPDRKRPGGPEAARPEPCRDYTLIGRIPARNLLAYWQLHLLPFLMYGVKNTASFTCTVPLKGGVNLLQRSRNPSLIGRVWYTASDKDT